MQYRIFSWNVNGIRSTVKKGFINWLLHENPQIVCIQETKANEDQIAASVRNPNGYRSVWHSATKKGYSGVATYYQKHLKPKVIKSINNKEFDDEGRVIITKFDEFTLLNVYFPNGKKDDIRLDYKMRFYAYLQQFCADLRAKGEKLIICGDVNTAHKEIDLTHPKPNAKYSGFLPQERAWIDKFLADGYVDALRYIEGEAKERYTWWVMRAKKVDGKTARERNVGWRIDYFFVSDDLKENLKATDIHKDVMGSDHCPISITLEF